MSRNPDLAILHHVLREYFSLPDLRTLCFDLGVDYDDLLGDTKEDKARELVTYLQRRGRLSELVKVVKALRPNLVLFQDAQEANEQPVGEREGSTTEQSLVDKCINNIRLLVRAGDDTTLSRLGRAYIFDTCRSVSGNGRAQLLRFVYYLGLIYKENRVIDLCGINLSNAELAGDTLIKASLSGANLWGANLKAANLTRADLSEADLRNATLDNADLSHASLRQAKLRHASLKGACLEGAIKRAGRVMAGEGLEDQVDFDGVHEADLCEAEIYYFDVEGNSMEHKEIRDGDKVIVRVSNEEPGRGIPVVAKYKAADPRPIILGEAASTSGEWVGPVIKTFQEKDGGIFRLQGRAIKRKLDAIDVKWIGTVEATCPTSSGRTRKRKGRDWRGLEWSDTDIPYEVPVYED